MESYIKNNDENHFNKWNISSNQGLSQINLEDGESISKDGSKHNYATESDNNKCQKNEIEKNEFIKALQKIFIYFFQRIDFLLKQENEIKILDFKNYDFNDFNSIVKFLTEINNLSNKQFDSPSVYEIKDEKLKSSLFQFLCGDEDFISLMSNLDDDFSLEKYSPNDTNQNKNLINKLKLKIPKDIFLLKIKQINPILKDFQEFKNFLKNECKFSNKDFDSRGDFIIPNLSNNNYRGTEKYYPPYGYNGIGLNVYKKYEEAGALILDKNENSKWANAYLSLFPEKNSNEDFKGKIRDLCFKNEELVEEEVNFKDARHWKTQIKRGSGVYLNYKFENAEKDVGLIKVNDENYKILFMARVKINEICQPKGKDVWVLNKEFIRIYRILFKKI